MASIFCGKKPAPVGKRKGTSNECFKRGLGAGFKAGIDQEKKKGKVVSKKAFGAGKKSGKKIGETIGKRKLTLGNKLTQAEVLSLNGRQLQSIMGNRNKRGLSNMARVGSSNKAQLQTALIANLRQHNQLS